MVSGSSAAVVSGSSFGIVTGVVSLVVSLPRYFSATGLETTKVTAATIPKRAAVNKRAIALLMISLFVLGCFTIFSLIKRRGSVFLSSGPLLSGIHTLLCRRPKPIIRFFSVLCKEKIRNAVNCTNLLV